MQDFSSTLFLIQQFKNGDKNSSEKLFQMYQPILLRWAHGRVPQQARGFLDTNDIVQNTMMLVFKNINNIKSLHRGSFFVYLRTTFINQIKQELRKNKPFQLSITQFNDDVKASYEQDMDTLLDYDKALELLSADEKEAVIMRMEFGFSYQEIADILEKPSANSLRMMISRALLKLAEKMN